MIAYKITYERTGTAGTHAQHGSVILYRAGRDTNDHESLEDEFEQLAAEWGTHESRHAIVEVIGLRIG